MEDLKTAMWLCMLVAAFLSGKMLGYESRKHDEREEQKPNYLKNLLYAVTYSIYHLQATSLRPSG